MLSTARNNSTEATSVRGCCARYDSVRMQLSASVVTCRTTVRHRVPRRVAQHARACLTTFKNCSAALRKGTPRLRVRRSTQLISL
jgi:hypothetical protein